MIRFEHVSKAYLGGRQALQGVTFHLHPGEMAFLIGHSGAGKTTLFRLLAAIERPTSGSLLINGKNIGALSNSAIPYLRRKFGLIFQDQKLLFDRNALDNVLLPLKIAGLSAPEALRRARAALDKVGLLDREKASLLTLSGGEQQRLAIARAVVNRPTILLADEPTANLDQDSAAEILGIFRAFHQVGVTLIVATHDPRWIARLSPRILRLDRGSLLENAE